MTMARKCEACNRFIDQPHYIALSLCVYKSDGSETQDSSENVYGDYCNACVLSGEAVKNLLAGVNYSLKVVKRA
jgi:hypothetical protein